MSWFRRKKSTESTTTPPRKVDIQAFEYPSKVVLAWAKAIEGDANFLQFLNNNGYEELAIAVHAVYLEPNARDWLTENGFAHLMAMIHGAEGNEKAQRWLSIHGFSLLYHLARAVDHEQEDIDWMKQNAPLEFQILAKSLQQVKDHIEENHNDMHSFNKDV